jgi:hypothetical protein
MLEWFMVIKMFYDKESEDKPKMRRIQAIGTGWSFILDVPALVGLSVMGNFWIC